MGGGNKSKTIEYNQTDPWAPQQTYLLDAFNQAKSAYNSSMSRDGYSGDFVAGYRPEDLKALDQIANWSNTTGQNAVNTQMGTGSDLFTTGAQGMKDVSGDLKDFQTKDWTQTHIDNAGRYADNPFMQAMIDAATSDAKRTFSEQTMRGIDQNAAATGNINSTRAGVAAGIAQRGLSDFVGNTSATMRGNAWDKGLEMSQADQSSILSALLGRGDLATAMTGAGQTAMDSAFANEAGLLGLNTSVAEMQRANAQSGLDNEIAKSEYANNRQWDALNNYYGIVGDKLWGSTSTGVTNKKEQASPLSTAASILGAVGSLFKSDVRTKNLIGIAGRTKQGHTLWRYTYKGELPIEYIAPLAQDVQATHPDAVVEVDGILYIDRTKYDWRG